MKYYKNRTKLIKTVILQTIDYFYRININDNNRCIETSQYFYVVSFNINQ